MEINRLTNEIDALRDGDDICLALDSAIGVADKLEFRSPEAELRRQHAVKALADAFGEFEESLNAEETALPYVIDGCDAARERKAA